MNDEHITWGPSSYDFITSTTAQDHSDRSVPRTSWVLMTIGTGERSSKEIDIEEVRPIAREGKPQPIYKEEILPWIPSLVTSARFHVPQTLLVSTLPLDHPVHIWTVSLFPPLPPTQWTSPPWLSYSSHPYTVNGYIEALTVPERNPAMSEWHRHNPMRRQHDGGC